MGEGAHRRVTALAAVVALCSALLVAHGALAHWDSDPYNLQASYLQNEQCGANDLPEGRNPDGSTYDQIQGDVPKADQQSGRAKLGYNCGLALVSHLDLGFTKNGKTRPATGNANMAWAGHCAYVADGGTLAGPVTPSPVNGVAVIDVAETGAAKVVDVLREPGTTQVAETIGAVTTPSGRSILVVGQYGNPKLSPPPVPMDVYDVTDCAHPRHLATAMWPENIHNLSVTPDGKYVLATMPLQVADISALWDGTAPVAGATYLDPGKKVKYLGDVEVVMEGAPVGVGPSGDYWGDVPAEIRQTQHPTTTGHEAWPNNDWLKGDRTIFIGSQQPNFENFFVVDLGAWLDRPDGVTPKGAPKTISNTSGRAHSMRTATIKGVPYLLHSEESIGVNKACLPETFNPFAGAAQPWLTDISDRTQPRLVSQMALAINKPENCPAALNSNTSATVHYHDVDNPFATTFVMASMWNAGIRIWDVRDPKQPTEVGYFNPGDVNGDPAATTLDQAWAHVRYVPRSGQIWFTTATGGFWVVRVERGLRDHLGLSGPAPRSDPGRPGTVGVHLPKLTAAQTVSIAPYYCTIGALVAPAGAARVP